jgi:hypothetical protein
MSDREIMEAKGLGNTKKYPTSPSRFSIPELDPVTGELNPYYEELTGKKNPLDIKHMPNQKWHRYVSFMKSGVRILGYALIPFNLGWAVTFLILSEGIGIIEELV